MGALQGLNKSETAQKYGEDQVKIWRRSFDIQPPALEGERTSASPRGPRAVPGKVDPASAPPDRKPEGHTIARVIPYFEQEIRPPHRSGVNAW